MALSQRNAESLRLVVLSVTLAGLWVSASGKADPPPPFPPGIEIPDVFCFRMTDIAEVDGDPEEDRFIFQFELLNWTGTQSFGLYLALNTGTSVTGVQQLAPFFVGASIDSNGRPLGSGDDDLNFPPNDGEGGIKIGQINAWTTILQTNTAAHYVGRPGTLARGLMSRDLLGSTSTTMACSQVPACTIIGGFPVLSSPEAVDNGRNRPPAQSA